MKSSGGRIPRSTYRFQFNRDFTFQKARALIPYLHELGITDIYASPIFTAPPESNHGYDVCDYNQINPMLGSKQDWMEFTDDLRGRDMGMLLDFVPNHMGASPKFNPWWRDVLEYGVESPYAKFFDVDWNPVGPPLKDRVLLPVLEDHYGRVLNAGIFKLAFEQGRLEIKYHDFVLPICPRSYRHLLEMIGGQSGAEDRKTISELIESLPGRTGNRAEFEEAKAKLSRDETKAVIAKGLADFNELSQEPERIGFMHQLLEEQAYQLAFWRTGTRVANYRRFFDVDSLIAVNMDRPEVFDAAHQLLGECVALNRVTGIRLDHIDGLADPAGYLIALQHFIATRRGVALAADRRGFYLLVEKITTPGEELSDNWPVFGTTGYEFAALAAGVLVDRARAESFSKIYEAFVPGQVGFPEVVLQSKRLVMTLGLSKEIAILSRLLKTYACEQRDLRDLFPADLTTAIIETIARFPVYRTYLTPDTPVNPVDRAIIENAIAQARSENPGVDSLAFDCLQQILLAAPGQSSTGLFRKRFQQFTGPIMAKGYEDTAFFVFNRLIALNEVGGEPACEGIDPDEFHSMNEKRFARYPNAMISTSSHDTKLSEDARARAMALSEIPERWAEFLQHAAAANAVHKKIVRGKPAPDANEEYRFYQILFATWPLEELTGESCAVYTTRLQQHMLKALREAKVNTRWDAPDGEWEKAVTGFIGAVINAPAPEFRACFNLCAEIIAQLGALNSLSQTLLKLTCPGVPDIYQGNELWQFILTDPDNRGPIDFELRQNTLASLKNETPDSLLRNWRTGAIKMFLTRTVLSFRREHPLLFERGDYVPLAFAGEYRTSCLGFARRHADELALVLIPRLTAPLGFPPIGDCWKSTVVDVHSITNGRTLRNLFANQTLKGNTLPLANVFHELPFAVLIAEKN